MSDEIDRANDQALYDTDMALRNARLHRDHGEQRIDHGHVLCVDCGAEISPARLTALPHCWRCLDCQAAHERESARWS